MTSCNEYARTDDLGARQGDYIVCGDTVVVSLKCHWWRRVYVRNL